MAAFSTPGWIQIAKVTIGLDAQAAADLHLGDATVVKLEADLDPPGEWWLEFLDGALDPQWKIQVFPISDQPDCMVIIFFLVCH